MRKLLPRILLVTVMILAVVGYFYFDVSSYLKLDYLKSKQTDFKDFYSNNRELALCIYALIYIVVCALSLPGATILTLAGGAFFGLGTGLLVVSFASTIGATLAFWTSRFLLRDAVETRFGDRLRAVNTGIRRDGAFYLFTLRLAPIFPFFVVNMVMGLTPISTWTYFWVSQIGMLPGTAVYVNAGTQLAQLDSLQGIMSPNILISFILLGIFPLASKRILKHWQARRLLAPWQRPKRYDYNLIVIGAGAGGLVSAYIAAAVKAKVLLIEKNAMGGDCLNTGCVPSKALIRSAKVLALAQRAKEFGFKSGHFEFDFAEVMARVQRVIKTIAPHDSVERYRQLGVECIAGNAMIRSPYEVVVNGKSYTTRNIIVATGGGPIVPSIAGLDEVGYLTSDTVWNLRSLPRRLLVLGAGPIGCELAQAFRRFGAEVTLVDQSSSILNREDTDIQSLILRRFRHEGIRVITECQVQRFIGGDTDKRAVCSTPQGEIRISFDAVLLAMGRKPHTQGFGLEHLGIRLEANGTIEHDALMRTNIPNIYCVGDVAGPYQFTHVAAHQAWYAAVNALFSPLKSFKADYRVIPRVTFTDPEVACVGLSEREAKERGIAYEVVTYGLDDLDRAIAEEEAHGFVKVLTVPGKDKILGATVVGEHAGDSFVEFIAAMRHGFGLNKILGTIHPYPTLAEANKYAAGAWKKSHAPLRLLRLVQQFHAWRRG